MITPSTNLKVKAPTQDIVAGGVNQLVTNTSKESVSKDNTCNESGKGLNRNFGTKTTVLVTKPGHESSRDHQKLFSKHGDVSS